MRKINKIVISFSEEDYGNMSRLRHRDISYKDYRTVGCHFSIANGKAYRSDEYESNVKDGEVEIGRPLGMAGAHTKGHNIDSVNIEVIGKRNLTDKQKESLSKLISDIKANHGVKDENIYLQDDLIYSRAWRSFNLNKFLKEYLSLEVA